MIFVGDIAIPHNYIPKFDLPQAFSEKVFWGNLEGPIISQEVEPKNILYNSENGFDSLLRCLTFRGFSLANNHITDLGSIDDTLSKLKNEGIEYNGAGTNWELAVVPARIQYKTKQISIFGFGWEVIKCEAASKTKCGVNPLKKQHVINCIKNELSSFPDNKIVVQFHWNYELELYPQPFERELAQNLIDLGVDAIIGCHSHRVQGIEIYNGKPIVYGLGNWLIPHGMFFNGKLKYPDFTTQQFGFEYDPINENHLIHIFEYNKCKETIVYKESCLIDNSEVVKKLTLFNGLSNKEYEYFFRQHRYQKKLLPVFYFDDTRISYFLKSKFIQLRHIGIKAIYAFKR